MSYNIILFETQRREKPVEEFIKSLSYATGAKIFHTVKLLKEFGPFLNMPHCKKLDDNIYELRIRGKEEIRIFYIFHQQNIYLLHAFKKKSTKIPNKELKIAYERAKDLTTR